MCDASEQDTPEQDTDNDVQFFGEIEEVYIDELEFDEDEDLDSDLSKETVHVKVRGENFREDKQYFCPKCGLPTFERDYFTISPSKNVEYSCAPCNTLFLADLIWAEDGVLSDYDIVDVIVPIADFSSDQPTNTSKEDSNA